jgi:hypothetical protein
MQKPSSPAAHAQTYTTGERLEDTPAPEQNGKHFYFWRNFAPSRARRGRVIGGARFSQEGQKIRRFDGSPRRPARNAASDSLAAARTPILSPSILLIFL